MTKAHMPPVPPAGRSNKGPGDQGSADEGNETGGKTSDSRHRDLSKQGRQGNIKQNTTHKGFQQDR
jgi:hypothetical protein